MKIFIVFIWVALSCYAFFTSAKWLPKWVHLLCSQGYDKLAHFVLFGIGFCVFQHIYPTAHPLSIAGYLTFAGILVEVIQGCSTDGRSFSALDILANMGGILTALLSLHIYNILKLHLI